MNNFNDFYGKLTAGSGSRIKNKKFFSDYSEETIDNYKKSIVKDLTRAKIKIKNSKYIKIMDVGTGRQSIAFSKLTKGKIFHYDISPTHIKNTAKYVEEKKIKNIKSVLTDVVTYNKWKKNYFDLIYLQGVIQHFSRPDLAIKKILKSTKINGYVWIYLYKSGSFYQFCSFLMRDFFRKKNIQLSINEIEKYKIFLEKKYSGVKNKFNIDKFVDDLFVPYAYLFRFEEVKKDFVNSGFRIMSKRSCLKNGEHYNHNDTYGAFIFSAKKIFDKNIFTDAFEPRNSINQIKINYKEPYINLTVKLFNRFAKKISKLSIFDQIDALYNYFVLFDSLLKINDGEFKHKKLHTFFIKYNS
jgi:ubiquinone/menaquinone biosynthesis C-methylase UbiE